jgi:hypothetical protein
MPFGSHTAPSDPEATVGFPRRPGSRSLIGGDVCDPAGGHTGSAQAQRVNCSVRRRRGFRPGSHKRGRSRG